MTNPSPSSPAPAVDPQIQYIDNLCAKKAPIRLGQPHGFNTDCHPLDERRRNFLTERYSGGGDRVALLRDGIVGFGGSFVIIPSVEEDMERLISRGQLWGPNSKMLRGATSKCHSNSVMAWEANQDKLFLATGYALSGDGVWRQHSWCVNPRPRSIQIIETTVARMLYFGHVMTLEETVMFADYNTDFGVEVEPETYARYGLEAPAPAERMRA